MACRNCYKTVWSTKKSVYVFVSSCFDFWYEWVIFQQSRKTRFKRHGGEAMAYFAEFKEPNRHVFIYEWNSSFRSDVRANLRRNMLVLQHRVMWSILRKLLLQPDRYTRTEQAWTRPVNGGRQDAAPHATRTPPGRRKQARTSPERPVDPALTATNTATTS